MTLVNLLYLVTFLAKTFCTHLHERSMAIPVVAGFALGHIVQCSSSGSSRRRSPQMTLLTISLAAHLNWKVCESLKI